MSPFINFILSVCIAFGIVCIIIYDVITLLVTVDLNDVLEKIYKRLFPGKEYDETKILKRDRPRIFGLACVGVLATLLSNNLEINTLYNILMLMTLSITMGYLFFRKR